jgi:hypothetical protein
MPVMPPQNQIAARIAATVRSTLLSSFIIQVPWQALRRLDRSKSSAFEDPYPQADP